MTQEKNVNYANLSIPYFMHLKNYKPEHNTFPNMSKVNRVVAKIVSKCLMNITSKIILIYSFFKNVVTRIFHDLTGFCLLYRKKLKSQQVLLSTSFN